MDNDPNQIPELKTEEVSDNEKAVREKPQFKWLIIAGAVILLGLSIIAFYIVRSNTTDSSKLADTSAGVNSQDQSITTDQVTGAEASNKTIKQTDSVDIHNLPLGDGKYGNSPKIGYIYSCQTTFNGGGASHTGDWIHGDTWDLSEKTQVQGKVSWPNAQFSISTSGNSRIVAGNGLPVDTYTGTFPIANSDPAYQIDRNPNSIKTQNISFSLPINPTMAKSPSCVPMGMVGVALNGVAIYNGLDEAGRDAVAHETQDLCDGHPQGVGEYHYHGPSDCLPNEKKNNTLIGYALDGYGIYSMYNAAGVEYTDAKLDACHGTTSEILWNGKMVNMYHYVLTQEYPYTIGCFRGSNPVRVIPNRGQNATTQMMPPKGIHPSGMRPSSPQKVPVHM